MERRVRGIRRNSPRLFRLNTSKGAEHRHTTVFVMMRLGSGGQRTMGPQATINETLDMDPWAARDSVSFG